MKHMLDTNICIYIMNRRPLEVIRRFKQFDVGDIGISSITVSELYYGVNKSQNPEKNLQRLTDFLMPFDVIPYDEDAANVYGRIRVQLQRQGQLIGPMDLLIAAHALSRDLILVTNNDREFRRVAGLTVENWVSSTANFDEK